MKRRRTIMISILCISLCFSSLLLLTQAADTLTPSSPLADGTTLISSDGVFELGFFSPNTSTNRYLGIWYHNFSTNTVLWVANRESPVSDTSGTLKFSSTGDLIIVDRSNTTVWSTNTSTAALPSKAKLLTSGNLQLNDSGGNLLWQSFDHPTDTYLPGMKVGLDLTTNVNQVFSSWKSSTDPAKGNYTMGTDPNKSTQTFIWDGNRPRWRSGRWDGQVFTGVEGMVPQYVYGFKLSNSMQEGKMYFYYSAFNASHRYVLTWDGILKHMIWMNDTQDWYQYWAQPVQECEFYNKCGNYGSCTENNNPICTCLQGFIPKSSDEWNSGNWTSGCTRRTPLQCERNTSNGGQGEPDGFLKLTGVKLPDSSDWIQGIDSISQCEEKCLANCSCKGYSSPTGIGCLIWGSDLVDIHMFSIGGDDLYLRLAGSELDKKSSSKTVIIVIIILAVVFLLGSIYLVWKYKKRFRAFINLRKGQRESVHDQSLGGEGPNGFNGASYEISDEGHNGKNQDSLLLSFDSIVAATRDFALSNLLGEGGFGPVYKVSIQTTLSAFKTLCCTNTSNRHTYITPTLFARFCNICHINIVVGE